MIGLRISECARASGGSTTFWSLPIHYYALIALGIITPLVDSVSLPNASPASYTGTPQAWRPKSSRFRTSRRCGFIPTDCATRSICCHRGRKTGFDILYRADTKRHSHSVPSADISRSLNREPRSRVVVPAACLQGRFYYIRTVLWHRAAAAYPTAERGPIPPLDNSSIFIVKVLIL